MTNGRPAAATCRWKPSRGTVRLATSGCPPWQRDQAQASPAAGDLVLLADPRLVLEPDLYRFASGLLGADLRHDGGEVFLTPQWPPGPAHGAAGALNAVRLREGRHDALATAEGLEMATAGAAEAMGMGGRIGRLTPGREADMILVDLDRPHLQPFYGDIASLVYYARASDVADSIVRGRMVMRDGEIPGVDAEAALAEVKARAPHWGALMRELGGVSHLPACPCGAH